MAATSNKYTFGRGELYFARWKDGTTTPDGFRYIGNTPAFGFTIQSQSLQHFNSDHGVGELDLEIPTQVTRSGSFTTDNISTHNLGLFLFGSAAKITATSATALSETIVGAHVEHTYQLGVSDTTPAGRRALSTIAVKNGTSAGTAYTAGVDYVVDAQRGLLTPVQGGAIVEGTSLYVSYNQVASTFDQVVSGNKPVQGSIMFVADNPEGDNLDYLLPAVTLTPNGEFALKADNTLQQMQFNMSVRKLPTRAAYYVNGQAQTTA